MNYLAALPSWGMFLVYGIIIFINIAAGAVILTRMGRSPYWAFLLLLPLPYAYALIAAIWYLAFSPWPKALKKE